MVVSVYHFSRKKKRKEKFLDLDLDIMSSIATYFEMEKILSSNLS